jgi:RNA recognition motif-containing protein
MFSSAGCELYIGNLDSEVNEEGLFSIFSRYGSIQSMKIMRHVITHESRGFGFVTFRSNQEALKAQKEMQGTKFFRNTIKVYLKEQYNRLDPQANLVITEFPSSLTEAELLALGEKQGPVFSVKIVPGDNTEGRTQDKAYIQFETVDVARKALQALNGSDLNGQVITVDQTGKKNKIFIKADNSEDVVEQVKAQLGPWLPVELGKPDVSDDTLQCILLAKFENDLQARAFLQDFYGDKTKCSINRWADKGRLRATQPQAHEEELQERQQRQPFRQVLPCRCGTPSPGGHHRN